MQEEKKTIDIPIREENLRAPRDEDNASFGPPEEEQNYFSIHDEKWPMVYIHVTGVIPVEDDELKRCLNEFKELYEKKERIQVVINLKHLTKVTLKQIIKFCEIFTTIQDDTEKYVEKLALVIKSKVVAKFLRVILKMWPPVCPVKIFLGSKRAKMWVE